VKRPALEVADIIRAHGAQFRQHHPTSREQRRALAAIEHCRTATLGAHREQCDRCGEEVIAYNSCRNRHCPKCQGSAQTAWVSKQQADLLPAPYFHLVFTLPDELAPLALQNQRVIYDLLFGAAWDTLRTIAADPRHLGAQVGMIAVLHTWGQSLTHHPHLHCVVPGGGLSPDGTCWIASRKKFFLPVKVLSRLFRRLFLTALQNAFEQAQLALHGQLAELNQPLRLSSLLAQLWRKEWVVYAKRPFGGPAQVLNYLGRYTHRVARSLHRLLKLEDGQVTFRWKDYRDGRQKLLTLGAEEFLRRFLLHILPDRFVRIRHYGLLSPRRRSKQIAHCRQLLCSQPEATQLPPASSKRNLSALWRRCQSCEQGRMRLVEIIEPGRLAQLQIVENAQPP
jgi:Putative transposase/Transposase zinc-binding domain